MFAWNEMSCWAYCSPLAKNMEDGYDASIAASVNEAERSPPLESWADFNTKPCTAEVGRELRRSMPPLSSMTRERDEACRLEIDNLFDVTDVNDNVDIEIDATGNSAAPIVLLDTPLFRRLRSMDRDIDRAGKPAQDADRHRSRDFGEMFYSCGLSEDVIELDTERLTCAHIEEILSPNSSRDSFPPTLEDVGAKLNNRSQALNVGKHCDVDIGNHVINQANVELLSEDETHPVFEKSNRL